MHSWDPEEYEKSSSAQQLWARDLIFEIGLRGDEHILDIGCGDGKISAELATLVKDGSVTGIDNSPEMIRFAESKFPQSKYPNLIFQLGDARNLSFSDKFDLVVSFACLHWIHDHRPILQGIRRSLKVSGKTYLQFGGKGNAAAIMDIAGKLISNHRWEKYFEGFTAPFCFPGPDEYRAMVERAGLKPTRVELVPKTMVQTGREGLASWINSTWLPYLERVPEDLRPDLVYEMVDEYVRTHPPDEQGKLHIDMVRLEAMAEKVQE